ncbi:oxidoreductase [Candidatus Marinamargulisbacteria bacterium SCGC AG-410-N11]|nr:oxidoreductase [Candidatus Marinamargulisbacteria bacterium SCGC AG-410-N11]
MVKICVVGSGRWGKNHIRTLSEMGHLSGIIDTNKKTLSQFKSLYPNVSTFSSISELGADQYDAYVIATPAKTHFELAKALLLKKKHLLVEKPITLQSSKAKELTELANNQQVILMTGHLLLFHPAIRKIKSFIESGKIGKLQYMYSNRLNLGTVRTHLNSLWSFAPHDVSIFDYLAQNLPTNVISQGGSFLQPKIQDTTMTMLHYPNNIVGHIFVSWLHPFKEHRLVIIGSKGMLSYEDSSDHKQLLFYEKGIDFINGEPVKRDGATQIIDYPKEPPLKNELNHFIECIKGNEKNTLINGEKGYDVLKILERADACLNHSSVSISAAQSDHFKSKLKNKSTFIHTSATVDPTAQIGQHTKVWNFSNIQKNATIGNDCILGQNVNIGPNVTIGNNCKIQNNVSIYEGVQLDDYVFCGPSMVFTNINIPRSKYPQAESKFYIKTHVKEGASIGANATIVCGVTLGKHCLIGAGAVITKDVPDYAIVVGNPGNIVGWISEAGTKLDFSKSNKAFCEKCNKWYQITKNIVSELPINSQVAH